MYDKDSQSYMFNPVFRHFVTDILNNKTTDVIYNITLDAANTYKASHNYYAAIALYSRIGHYQEIYDSDVSVEELYEYVIKSNKDIFLDIANHYWSVEKKDIMIWQSISALLCFCITKSLLLQSLYQTYQMI